MGSKKYEVDISNVIEKQLRSGKNYLNENAAVNSRSAPLENVLDESLKDGMSNWNYWNNWNYSEPDLSLDISNTVPFPILLTPTLSPCISPATHTSTPRILNFETSEMSVTATEPPVTRTDADTLTAETLSRALGELSMDGGGEGIPEGGGVMNYRSYGHD